MNTYVCGSGKPKLSLMTCLAKLASMIALKADHLPKSSTHLVGLI